MSVKRPASSLPLPAPPAPSSAAGTPGPSSSRVKQERGDGQDAKRRKTGTSPPGALADYKAKQGRYMDPKTAALELRDTLKKQSTLNYEDAQIYLEERSPGINPDVVLEMLKGLERVEYNVNNGVYTYVPELQITSLAHLRSHLRAHASLLTPVDLKTLRLALPPTHMHLLQTLEDAGDIHIMRALQGHFKDVPLPALGKKNVHGLTIMDLGSSGMARYRGVWWDGDKERGRAGTRVSDDLIWAWDEVQIAETDDVGKLLSDMDLTASSIAPPPPKVTASAPKKPKKRGARMKITNVHMKDQGVDFSKDYQRPE